MVGNALSSLFHTGCLTRVRAYLCANELSGFFVYAISSTWTQSGCAGGHLTTTGPFTLYQALRRNRQFNHSFETGVLCIGLGGGEKGYGGPAAESSDCTESTFRERRLDVTLRRPIT